MGGKEYNECESEKGMEGGKGTWKMREKKKTRLKKKY